jgi:hypothetical protein
VVLVESHVTVVASHDKGTNGWRWRFAWDPGQIVLNGFLLGFFAGAITLLPLGILLGSVALLVAVLLPIVGAIGGVIAWKLSVGHVRDAYQEVLEQFYESQATRTGDEDIWLTPLKGVDSRYGLEAAGTYDFTRVQKTSDEVTMANISLDLASLETTEQATILPVERVNSISYEDDTLIVDARTGTWCFEGIVKNPQEGDSQAVETDTTGLDPEAVVGS